jgi:Anaphase-promoting complex APC subunit CDC26
VSSISITQVYATYPDYSKANLKRQVWFFSHASRSGIKMLRRKPTSITLTTEDVAIYEDTRARENQMREQAALLAQMQAQGTAQNKNQNIRDPNDELRPLPGERARAQQVKTRDERLGLMGGGTGSSRA